MAASDIHDPLTLIGMYFPQLSAVQKTQFAALGALYHFWNQRINVISRKDIHALYERHVLHSLSIALCYRFPPGRQVIDIGTGGGFPGIPLAILFPETEFILIDAIGKKIKVVQDIIQQLHLTNVLARQQRAEQLPPSCADDVVSRAVAPLSQLWQWAQHILRPGPDHGLFCLKGGDLRKEIQECGCQPVIHALYPLLKREYFQEKYLLYLPQSAAPTGRKRSPVDELPEG